MLEKKAFLIIKMIGLACQFFFAERLRNFALPVHFCFTPRSCTCTARLKADVKK